MVADIRDKETRPTLVCVVVLVVLHLLFCGQVFVFGAAPGLLLAATCVLASSTGRSGGVVGGFVLGLLFDLTGSGPVGLASLLFAVAGYALGSHAEARLPESLRAKLPSCCVACGAVHVACPLFLLAFGVSLGLGWTLVGRILVGTLVDALVCGACLWALDVARGGRTSGGMRLS